MNALAKLTLCCGILAIIANTASSDRFQNIIPTIIQKYYNLAPTQTGYRLIIENPNGSRREELQMILYPGTPKQETIVMGMYSVYDEKTNTETITMYTTDKNGYKPRFSIKRKARDAKVNKALIS